MTRPLHTHWEQAPKGSRGVCDAMTRHPGVPLATDLGELVGRHRLVYDAPAAIWEEGLPLGNGDLAAMAYQPRGSYCWGLTKADIRDLRNPVMPFHPHEEWVRAVRERRCLDTDWMNEEEWEFYREDYFPCFLPAGGLFLGEIRKGDLAVRRQELDLYTAVHRARLRRGGEIESFVFHGANVLAVRLRGMKGRRFALRLSPEGVDPRFPGYVETETAKTMRREVFRRVRHCWTAEAACQRVDYADGHRALTVAQVRGGRFTRTGEGLAGSVLLADADEVMLLLTITTAREAAYLQRRAERTLQGAWQRGYARLETDHRMFWHERWSRSQITIPDRALEAQWWFALYTMAASSRGAYPVPLMSAWNVRLDQPYHGDYHNNINSQMCYWPVFAANHADLAEVYARHFREVLPEMEMETRRVWNLPGVKVPFACAGRGLDFWGVGYWRYEFFVSAWTAQIAWWHYEHTLDKDFLRRHGWPLLQAVADFYAAYLERDPATGRLSLPLAKLCEDTMFNAAPDQRLVRDVGLDLAAIHSHLRDAVRAAQALGLSADAKRYAAVLKDLAPVPVADGEFALAAEASRDLPISHPYTIGPIYPAELVTRLGPAKLLPVAEKSLASIWRCSSRVTAGLPQITEPYWNDDLSMGWLGAARAWMGDGEGARDAILNGWVAGCLKTNGFLARQARPPADRPAMPWMQNQTCGLANVVNEMLLQSHSGVIQVFPAAPAAWRDAAFANLLARGAFLVSALRRGGVTRWVAITSRRGGEAKLLNPWGARQAGRIRLERSNGPIESVRPEADGCLRLRLAAGESVRLALAGEFPLREMRLAAGSAPAGPWAALRRRGDSSDWVAWWGKPAKPGNR